MVPKGVSGSADLTMSLQLFFRQTPVATVTKIWVFEHKIGYNSSCVADTSQILVPTGGFRSRPVSWCYSNWARLTPIAMVTKSLLF